MLSGVLCGLLAGALWGMVFIVPLWLAAYSPLELAVGRYVCYGAIALGLMLPRLPGLLRRIDRNDAGALLRHALAGNIVYYMLLAYGVALAGVAPTSLIIGLLPISVTLLGRNDHGAVPLGRLAWPLLLVAAGIACINVDAFHHADAGAAPAHILLGTLCAAAALVCWSWYAVDNTRYLKRHTHFSSAEWSALYGLTSGVLALLLGAAALLWRHGGDLALPLASEPGRNASVFWLSNAGLALGASVIANQLWNRACRRVPVTLSGQLILFETLFALLYGYLYKQQGPRPLEIAAITLLVAGVLWSVRVHAVHERPAPAPAQSA